MRSFSQAITASLCLALIGPFVKTVGTAVPVQSISFYRVFLGFLTLLIICPMVDKTTFRVKRSDWKHYMLIGLFTALAISFYCSANLHTSVANAVLITSTSIFLIPPMAAFVLKEKVSRIQIYGTIIAFVGILILNPMSSGGTQGNLYAFITAMNSAVLTVYMRFIDRDHGISSVMWTMFFASFFLAPMFFHHGPGDVGSKLPWVAGLGIVCTGLAYFFANEALERLDAETWSLIKFIITPLAGITLATMMLREPISWNVLIGGMFLVGAAVYISVGMKMQKSLPAVFRKRSLA